jgi:hypothetical protein
MARTYALPQARPLKVVLVDVVDPVDEPPR